MSNIVSDLINLFNRKKLKQVSEDNSTLSSDLDPLIIDSDVLDSGNTIESDKALEEEEYEVVEREILPAKIICPDCGGITLEGLDFCDKCGGELL